MPVPVVATAVSTDETFVVLTVFAALIVIAATPMQPRTSTPTTPSTIQSHNLLFFFGGCCIGC